MGQPQGWLLLWLVVLGQQESKGKGRGTPSRPHTDFSSLQRGWVKRWGVGAGSPKEVLIGFEDVRRS